MPRSIDHESRRTQITDAARRVIARDGLESATFQATAHEAGISVRLIQYYFGSKSAFLAATRRAVAIDAAGRLRDVLAALGDDASARERINAIITELLPSDDRRRSDAVVLAAFHAASLTERAESDDTPPGPSQALVDLLAAQLRGGVRRSKGTRDPRLDADLIVATAAGLVQGLIAGHYDLRGATAVIDRLLDALDL